MVYFKINDVDFSMYVNKLKVATTHKYRGMENAMGNTRVKYINSKYIIEVGIIPLDGDAMAALMDVVNSFTVKLSFLEPQSQELVEADCYISKHSVDYYTIQDSKVLYQAFSLVFTEL